ncbi:FAD-binding oxidoreductase, partial [bacterium]|nr:FAD-binding oxidoreductase [bacterium]
MIPLPIGNVPKTADAVIIGAGINGLALAYELGLRGMKNIVIVEKNYIGSGSTGRCGGG